MIPLIAGQSPRDPLDQLIETHLCKADEHAQPSDRVRSRVLADFDAQYAVHPKDAAQSVLETTSSDTAWPASFAQAVQRLFGLSPVPAMAGAAFAMVIGSMSALNVPAMNADLFTDQSNNIAENQVDTDLAGQTPEGVLLALLGDLEAETSAEFDESMWQGDESPTQSTASDGDRP